VLQWHASSSTRSMALEESTLDLQWQADGRDRDDGLRGGIVRYDWCIRLVGVGLSP